MKKAVVIFSGGQDSTTCLGLATVQYDEVEAITFYYGQKHSIEIEQSKLICAKYGVRQTLVDISFLNQIVDSALTSNGDVNERHPRLKNLPASFVPNRNQMFITIAHAYAQKIGAEVLMTGVCETDYSGYPDCRQEFISSIEKSTNLGSEANISIVTPLMRLKKGEIFHLAYRVGVLNDVVNLSHTCYNGSREFKYDWGYGCSHNDPNTGEIIECPACRLRRLGWEEFKAIMSMED